MDLIRGKVQPESIDFQPDAAGFFIRISFQMPFFVSLRDH